ncbi:hypothetical protein FA15DRAFT_667577 [Coprinopsis marcescibilis]|uniref:F-box domain-containing protein n=1 Tax=Coprinopsis marcescibilis TaxID=230819 RepID=A0A5C3L0Q4_COPMA|nr:hypothetical protein FA15DRAFT_667577 [Coprinopsis marcescibilis]
MCKDSMASTKIRFQELPVDILDPIIQCLTDRRDWTSCALVNRDFNRISTPLLYHSLDSRATSNTSVTLHPCQTLLQRPELAQHVRRVTESASIHRMALYNLTEDAARALALCKSLESFTWISTDDSKSAFVLHEFLTVLRELPIARIKIRAHADIGNENWEKLITLSGLESVSWFCMEGPPRVLQGWCEVLGPTLTHLELGRCAGVPSSVLISVLLQLPKLESLLLKGAAAAAVTKILCLLPNLKQLDTEYLPSSSSHSYTRSLISFGDAVDKPRSPLRELIIRASSLDSVTGPDMLWAWILENTEGAGASLEVFKLHAFVHAFSHLVLPRSLITGLAGFHGSTLRRFFASAQLSLTDIELLCTAFPLLEYIACSHWIEAGPDGLDSLKSAIAKGKNLRALRLIIQTRRRSHSLSAVEAADVMLRSEDSKLRFLAVDGSQFTGKWHLVNDADDVSAEELPKRRDYQRIYNSSGQLRTLKFIVTKTERTDSGEDW